MLNHYITQNIKNRKTLNSKGLRILVIIPILRPNGYSFTPICPSARFSVHPCEQLAETTQEIFSWNIAGIFWGVGVVLTGGEGGDGGGGVGDIHLIWIMSGRGCHIRWYVCGGALISNVFASWWHIHETLAKTRNNNEVQIFCIPSNNTHTDTGVHMFGTFYARERETWQNDPS